MRLVCLRCRLVLLVTLFPNIVSHVPEYSGKLCATSCLVLTGLQFHVSTFCKISFGSFSTCLFFPLFPLHTTLSVILHFSASSSAPCCALHVTLPFSVATLSLTLLGKQTSLDHPCFASLPFHLILLFLLEFAHKHAKNTTISTSSTLAHVICSKESQCTHRRLYCRYNLQQTMPPRRYGPPGL